MMTERNEVTWETATDRDGQTQPLQTGCRVVVLKDHGREINRIVVLDGDPNTAEYVAAITERE